MAAALVNTCTHVRATRTQRVTVIFSLGARVHLELTVATGPSVTTGALVRVGHVRACTTVHTRRRYALIVIDFTVVSAEAIRADAHERVNVVEARTPRQTRPRIALVRLGQARALRVVRKSSSTRTRVRVDGLRASRAVQAGRRRALVDVLLAQVTRETRDASTQVVVSLDPHVHGGVRARGAIQTRGRVALEEIDLAVATTALSLACVARERAHVAKRLALVLLRVVECGRVQWEVARLQDALRHNTRYSGDAHANQKAYAREPVPARRSKPVVTGRANTFVRGHHINARRPIQARVRRALVHVDLTRVPTVAGGALARPLRGARCIGARAL